MAQHVLIAVDGSEHSEKALDYVMDELPDPTITLVHVIEPPSSWEYSDEEYFDFEAYQSSLEGQRERAEQLLEGYREAASARGFDAETVLATGTPAREILVAIEDHDVDHVVMGSRGRSGVGRVLFGSVAEAVTRRSSVPVTIVR